MKNSNPVIVEDLSSLPHPEKSGAFLDFQSGLCATLWLLNSQQFTIQNFLEFCNFLEAAILFPRLYTSPNPTMATADWDDLDEFTQDLITNGVLSLVWWPDTKNLTTPERHRYNWVLQTIHNQDRVEPIDTLHGVQAHSIYNMTVQPSVYNRFTYLQFFSVGKSIQAALFLDKAYISLSRAAEKAVESLAEYRGVEELFIPPIPAIVMNEASTRRDILPVLLEVRERFSPVRSAFEEYNQIISDPSLPLKKSIRAISVLKTVVEELARPFEDPGTRVVAEWSDLADLIPTDSDFNAEDAKSLTKLLLGKPLELLLARLKRRRFMPLFSLRSSFLKLGGTQALVKKLWGCELTDADISLSRTYTLSPKRVQMGDVENTVVPEPKTFWSPAHKLVG